MASTRDTFFNGISLIFLVEVFPDFFVVAAPVPLFYITCLPVYSSLLYRYRRSTLPCRYHQLFHRVQSFRNLAHSCWPRVHQLHHRFLHNWIAQDVTWVRVCHSTGSCRKLALPLSDSARDASGAPSASAPKERFLQAIFNPFLLFPIVQIALYTPASCVLSPLSASCCIPQTVSPTYPCLPQFWLFFSHSAQLVSCVVQIFHCLVSLYFFIYSDSLGWHGNCEL